MAEYDASNPRPYVPPTPTPQPDQRTHPEWYCMHGCGAKFGEMALTRTHESSCKNNPNK